MAPKKPFRSWSHLKILRKLLKHRFFSSIPIRPWSDLPPEILFLIISTLSVQDRVRCRRVCRSWDEAERLKPPPLQLPWLMLSLRPEAVSQRFFTLTDTTMIQVKLPEKLQESMCCGSIDGSLVFSYDSCITLLNPLSKSLTLYKQLSCKPVITWKNTQHFLRKVIFSSPPDTATSNRCHMAAIYDPGILVRDCGLYIIERMQLGDDFIIEDILLEQSILYTISNHEIVYMSMPEKFSAFPIDNRFKSLKIEQRVRQEIDLAFNKHVYLVQLCGSRKFVMVLRYYRGQGSNESSVMFKVYQLVKKPFDWMDPYRMDWKWVEMNNLEGHVIFLSSNCSRAIPASKYGGLGEDKIYFIDEIHFASDTSRDRYECGDIGVFCLKDKSITRLIESRVNSSHSPPAWFFHVNKW